MKVLLVLFIVSSLSLGAATDLATVVEPGRATYSVRFQLTYKLVSPFSDDDRARLERFLSGPPSSQPGLSEEELASLKNNVADVLIAQTGGPRNLLDRLRRDWADARQGMIWRNYIVQKAPELTVALANHAGAAQEAVTFLRSLAADREPDFSATAVIGMGRLSRVRPDLLPPAETALAARRLMREEGFPETYKIGVLPVWAEYAAEDTCVEARRILKQDSSHALLKMSALAVLGSHGRADDATLLQNFVTHGDIRLSTAAESAQSTLARRQPGR
jgi:hypothetical protein